MTAGAAGFSNLEDTLTVSCSSHTGSINVQGRTRTGPWGQRCSHRWNTAFENFAHRRQRIFFTSGVSRQTLRPITTEKARTEESCHPSTTGNARTWHVPASRAGNGLGAIEFLAQCSEGPPNPAVCKPAGSREHLARASCELGVAKFSTWRVTSNKERYSVPMQTI